MNAPLLLALMLAGTAGINALGSFFIAYAAKTGGALALSGGIAAYVIGAGLLCEIIRASVDQSLSVWGPVTSMAGLLLVTAAGLLWFKETLSPLQWIGVIAACAAIALIALGGADR